MALNPKIIERNLANVLRNIRNERKNVDKGIIIHLENIAKSLGANIEKLNENTEEINEEIEIVGGTISEFFRNAKENYSFQSSTIEIMRNDIKAFGYIIDDIKDTYGSTSSVLEKMNINLRLLSKTSRNIVAPFVLGITFLNKMADTTSSISTYGIELENIFLAIEKAQTVFIGSYDEIVSIIKNNAVLVQEYGLSPLENIIREVRNSGGRLYELGFTAKSISRLVVDALNAQRMLGTFEEKRNRIDRKFLLDYFSELHKASLQTGISVFDISEAIKNLTRDPEARFVFSMIPYNVQIALATISERFPTVFPLLVEGIKKGFSIFRIEDAANIQLIGMEKKFQKWLNEIREGTFTFENFIRDMHSEVERLDSFARINFFRQQEEAAKLASSLAYETRHTVVEVELTNKRKAVNEINQTMQNINILMLETQFHLFETLSDVVFSSEFDEFLGNFIDIMGVKNRETESKIKEVEKKVEDIEERYSDALVSQVAAFGILGVGSFKIVNTLRKDIETMNFSLLSKNFSLLFDNTIKTIENSTKTLTKTSTNLMSSLKKGIPGAAKGIKGAVKRKIKLPFPQVEKILKLRLGPIAIILSSIEYWADMVSLYSSYLNQEITENDFKVEFGKLLGRAAGGIGGLALLGSLGASIGSIAPGAGTIIGGLVGGTAGLFGGEYLGEKLGEYIAESIVLGKNSEELENIKKELETNAPEIKEKFIKKMVENQNLIILHKDYVNNIVNKEEEFRKKIDSMTEEISRLQLPNTTKTKMILSRQGTDRLGE